jgi:hypothetical protein
MNPPTSDDFSSECLETADDEAAMANRTRGKRGNVRPEAVRLIEPVEGPVQIRTERTLVSQVLGYRSSLEAILFHVGVRSSWTTGFLWLLWLLGVLIGFAVILDMIPIYFVWACLMMLPLPFVTFSLLSKDLVALLLMELDIYLITILQMVLFATATHYLHDNKLIFWYCYIPTLIVAPFVDGYPAKYRPLFSTLFFIGLLGIFLLWNAILIWKFHTMSPVRAHIGDNVTLALFYGRHLWTAHFSPDTFIVLKSSIRTFQETVNVSPRGIFREESKVAGRLKLSKATTYNSFGGPAPSSDAPRTAVGLQPRFLSAPQ